MIVSAFGDVHWKDGIGRLREAAVWFGAAPSRAPEEKIATLPALASIEHAKAS